MLSGQLSKDTNGSNIVLLTKIQIGKSLSLSYRHLLVLCRFVKLLHNYTIITSRNGRVTMKCKCSFDSFGTFKPVLKNLRVKICYVLLRHKVNNHILELLFGELVKLQWCENLFVLRTSQAL